MYFLLFLFAELGKLRTNFISSWENFNSFFLTDPSLFCLINKIFSFFFLFIYFK